MWKFRSFGQLVPKPFHSRTFTILADGNGKNNNKMFCSDISLDFGNDQNSPVKICELNKTNLKNYKFPMLKISYNQEDVVEHAKSLGIHPGDKHADLYLDKRNPKLQPLPSFMFPFTNKIIIDLGQMNPSAWMSYHKGLHGEHYTEQLKQLPPQGVINLEIKLLDVLDKGKGTLYCWNINGYDENGEIYFKMEYQIFEMGTGGFNGNRSNPYLTRIVEPNNPSIPDHVFEFPTFVPMDGYKFKLSDSDMKIPCYSSTHPRQYYASECKYMPYPIAHGRYTFGGVIKTILFNYGDGNVEKFKAAKVRFADPVFPCENILISTWKEDSRIIFQGNVQRNGKEVRVLTGGYIDLDL